MIYYSIQEKLTCSRIHSSTSADGWILPARHRCWRGTRRSRLPAQLRRLLPGAGGHRAVGLRPLANRGPAAPAAPDRGPGLLPRVHRQVSHLPVLRLAPVREERNNCPFLTEDHCAIHDAEPLVCALYPLAQEISREGEVSYFLQPTGCGGRVVEAKVEDYLARYDVPAREKTDVRWAQTCMDLEDVVEPLDAALEPPLRRRMQAKLWQALYFKFDYEKEYLPQLEENLVWLGAELQKLTDYQQRRNTYRKK